MLSGLKILDVLIGDGPIAERGSRVTVRYTGYLNRGEVFQRDVVVTLVVGDRDIIAGLAWCGENADRICSPAGQTP